MIRTGVASGRLRLVRQGVVLRADLWPADAGEQHVMRARGEVAMNPDAVISHHSAAIAWGLPTPGFTPWWELPVAVTLPPSGHTSHRADAVHHVRALPATQISRDSLGYAVTSPARTAVDVAADLDLPGALAVLDGAARVVCASMVASIRRRDFANPRLARAAVDLLEEAAASTGRGRLRTALALVCPARESAPESLSAGHIHLAGLPTPRCQVEIRTSAGSCFPDFLWEEQRLIGECDGAVKYTDPQAVVLEKRREQALRDLGFGFVRWEAREAVLRPSRMLHRIASALGE